MPLDSHYDPAKIESRCYQVWEREGYFAPNNPDAQPYCIMIPPPNVTGNLHMGHAFQDMLMDALIRYHRMQGRNTLWQVGTDHAGIATQMVVERLLGGEGKTRADYGREKFIARVWQWKQESGDTISRQLRRLGTSPDWENERFTMDAGLSAAVNQVFVELFEAGLIYRGKRLVNWDPVLLTAVSDLEVVSEDESGVMTYVRYPFVDGDAPEKGSDYADGVVIGTTRPETILVDGAIAVHPDDPRFVPLQGRRVWVPLTEPPRAIEIIADDYVQSDFGSGCVKITAAHDFNDYAVYQRHPDKDIPLIVLLTADAKMNENAPKKYRGLDRYVARQQIVEDLGAQGYLVKQEPHQYKLPRGDRSGAVVEPMLTDQWYVDLTRDHQADGRPGGKTAITIPALEAVRQGEVKFVPENWRKTYYQWLENIEDWCISRQIWWGHRIPAWYDDAGKVYVAKDEAAVREKYRLAPDYPLRQDEDVLDTWFSSALWPFSTLGWPQDSARLKTFYPTSVLVTGFDIIFFWVARMIMFGKKFLGEVPFREVYIHGLVRDARGNKMSKSKGNVLDPIDLIDGIGLEELVKKRTSGMMQPQLAEQIAHQTRKDFPDGIPSFGTDALRFTFASLASTGRDINFDLGRVEGHRNFCNKIWNAARFVLMNCESEDCVSQGDAEELSLADRWMISTLQRSERVIRDCLAAYRLDLVAKEIHELIWHRYCDWYLELCKQTLNSPQSSPAQRYAARQTLVRVLETMLRLVHPIMPFISEKIWQTVAPLAGKPGDTIMLQPYPTPQPEKICADSEREMQRIMAVVLGIRKMRGENNISPAKRVPVQFAPLGSEALAQFSDAAQAYIKLLAKAESLEFVGSDAQRARGIMAVVGDIQIILPLDEVDAENERNKLQKELSALQKNVQKCREKLANPGFTAKAPSAVVAKEKQRLEDLQTRREKVQQRLAQLRS